MKNIKLNNIYIFLILSIYITSCEKGLDPVFHSSLTTENFPNLKSDYENLVLSTYAPFQSKWGWANGNDWGGYTFHCHDQYGTVFYNDFSTDLMAVNTDGWGGDWINGSNGDWNYLGEIAAPRDHFSKVRFISRITQIIEQIQNASSDRLNEEGKNALLGEALMSRAWIMWYLLYYYGPVPTILDASLLGTEAEWDLTPPSRQEYVNRIKTDLLFAAENLPPSWSSLYYGRYTSGLAYTVLMRLYMMEHQWQDAINTGMIIKGLGYKLVDDYASIFAPSGERNTEVIYAISTTEKSIDGQEYQENFTPMHYYLFPNWYTSEGINSWSTAQAVYLAHWNFVNSFDTLDDRKLFEDIDTIPSGSSKGRPLNGAIVKKFKVETTGTSYRGNDIILARYADILLMLAEAINENNTGPTIEAIGYVNEVRHRAGLEELPADDVANQTAFRNAILRERAWELYFEGFRRYDLIRMNKWEETLTQAGKSFGPSPMLPIPQYIINAGKGTINQNPAYAN